MRTYWDEFIADRGVDLLDIPLREVLIGFYGYLENQGVIGGVETEIPPGDETDDVPKKVEDFGTTD